jgi:hypothetical protein
MSEPLASIELPEWVWDSDPAGLLRAARLRNHQTGTNSWRIGADERHPVRKHANLFDLLTISRPDVPSQRDRWNRLSEIPEIVPITLNAEVTAALANLEQRLQNSSQLIDMVNHARAVASVIQPEHLGDQTRLIAEGLRGVDDPDGRPGVFADASVHFVIRQPELLTRLTLPSLMLGVEAGITRQDLTEAVRDSSGIIFAAGHGLKKGLYTSEAYFRPLLGSLSPAVWGFAATRSKGVIIFGLGRAINGAPGDSSELLQLLTSTEQQRRPSPSQIDATAIAEAVKWWVVRLDQLMSYVSDPAVHVDPAGRYSAIRQLEVTLTIEQLFTSMASLQGAYRDANAARTLAFTVLDSLYPFLGHSMEHMTDARSARTVLERVRGTMNKDAAKLLLPNAERGVAALDGVASGFYVRQRTGTQEVELTSPGYRESLPLSTAAAHYVKVIRNSTMHGHLGGSGKSKPRTQALLSHHDGTFPADLAHVAWLHFLDFMADPNQVRLRLQHSGRFA